MYLSYITYSLHLWVQVLYIAYIIIVCCILIVKMLIESTVKTNLDCISQACDITGWIRNTYKLCASEAMNLLYMMNVQVQGKILMYIPQ